MIKPINRFLGLFTLLILAISLASKGATEAATVSLVGAIIFDAIKTINSK